MAYRSLVLTLLLAATPSLALAQQYPGFTVESGLVCFSYVMCEDATSCDLPGMSECGTLSTGEQVCLHDLSGRFDFRCCESDDDCVDADEVQGHCVTFDQPEGDDIRLCMWAPTRRFGFCAEAAEDADYGDIASCLGEAQTVGESLAVRLRRGDCDDDGVSNAMDLCPCLEAENVDPLNGCPIAVVDGGIGGEVDGSTPDGSAPDGSTGASPDGGETRAQFGGAGGCEGCAAGTSNGDLTSALLVLIALGVRRRRA